MTFQKGVKFRIYPNREQRNLIDRTLGCSRLIYNKGLAMREDAFKSGEKCGYKQTSAMLTALKQDVNYAFLKEVDSIALQQALRNLDTGYTNFFEHRAAHPKFKSKKSAKQSYRTQPDEMILAALVEVDDKVSGKHYCSIRVWCSGHEIKTRSMGSYYVLNKHYLTVNKDDMVATYPYPFSCDDGANTLLEAKDTDILTPVERLFLWTEHKNLNPIETKKK